MDFKDNNLTKEYIRETLHLLKKSLEIFKEQYRGKTYIYSTGNKKIKVAIRDYVLPHLLGMDIKRKYSWWGYIGNKNMSNLEWLEEVVESEEFIEYMILKKKENKNVNFAMINYKADNFCNLNLESDIAIFFDYMIYDIIVKHCGVINDDKLISLKLIKEMNKDGSVYVPRSLYIYELDKRLNERIYDFYIPSSLSIEKKHKGIIETKSFCKDEINRADEKIKQFTMHQ